MTRQMSNSKMAHLVAASSAHPAPVAPPPMMRTSNGLDAVAENRRFTSSLRWGKASSRCSTAGTRLSANVGSGAIHAVAAAPTAKLTPNAARRAMFDQAGCGGLLLHAADITHAHSHDYDAIVRDLVIHEPFFRPTSLTFITNLYAPCVPTLVSTSTSTSTSPSVPHECPTEHTQS